MRRGGRDVGRGHPLALAAFVRNMAFALSEMAGHQTSREGVPDQICFLTHWLWLLCVRMEQTAASG